MSVFCGASFATPFDKLHQESKVASRASQYWATMVAGPLEVWSWIGIDKLPSNKWRAPQDWEEYRQQWLLGLLGFGAASTWTPTWRKLTNWKPVLINGAWTWSATLSWTTGSSLERKEIFSVCDLMTCQGFLYFHKNITHFVKQIDPNPMKQTN